MQLTVLGKYGPYAAAGGGTSAYLVQDGDCAVALDFGSGAMGRLQSVIDVARLGAVVLSHFHYDHICDLFSFAYRYAAMQKKLDLIVPNVDCDALRSLEQTGAYNIIPHYNGICVGGMRFEFKKMVHSVPSFAVKVTAGGKTLCYSGDTAYCEQLTEFAADADLLVLDCGKSDGSSALHLSFSQAEMIAAKLGVATVASHLNPELDYKTDSNSVSLACEMQTYKV